MPHPVTSWRMELNKARPPSVDNNDVVPIKGDNPTNKANNP